MYNEFSHIFWSKKIKDFNKEFCIFSDFLLMVKLYFLLEGFVIFNLKSCDGNVKKELFFIELESLSLCFLLLLNSYLIIGVPGSRQANTTGT